MTKPRPLIVAAWLVMAVPLLYAVVTFAGRSQAAGPFLEPAKRGSSCVFPAATARYEHGKQLRRLRDQVVRDGQRGALGGARPQGMTSCRGCHAQRQQFCDRCHERASVGLDCFACHGY
jgi:hypothetical protein